MILTQKCRKCCIEKPLSEFGSDSRVPNGYRKCCKICLYNQKVARRMRLVISNEGTLDKVIQIQRHMCKVRKLVEELNFIPT